MQVRTRLSIATSVLSRDLYARLAGGVPRLQLAVHLLFVDRKNKQKSRLVISVLTVVFPSSRALWCVWHPLLRIFVANRDALAHRIQTEKGLRAKAALRHKKKCYLPALIGVSSLTIYLHTQTHIVRPASFLFSAPTTSTLEPCTERISTRKSTRVY